MGVQAQRHKIALARFCVAFAAIFSFSILFAADGNPDDTYWQLAFDAVGFNNAVHALAFCGTDVYAGGEFSTAGNVSVHRIARWDGSEWHSLGTGVDGSGTYVMTIACYQNEVYIGGYFTTVSGVSAKNIAKWDGSAWHAASAGANGAVYSLVEYKGDLYAGGAFSSFDGNASIKTLARWNGSQWQPVAQFLASGGTRPGSIYTLVTDGMYLYVGGTFVSVDGLSASNIARWDGTNWTAFGSGLCCGYHGVAAVNGIALNGSEIYATGDFYQSEGTHPVTALGCVAHWDGSSWTHLGSGLSWVGGTGEDIPFGTAIANIKGSVYVGGCFNQAGGDSISWMAMWDGSQWNALGSGVNNIPITFVERNGILYAGGRFLTAGGKSIHCAARWTMQEEIAVAIQEHSVAWSGDHVEIRWRTSEVSSAEGFRAWRMDDGSARYLPLDAASITGAGREFTLRDYTASVGRSYRYKVDVLENGRVITSFEVTASTPAPPFGLEQNSPNPFNPSTAISFQIEREALVSLVVYDIEGKAVRTLVDRQMEPGRHTVQWNGTSDRGARLASGIYFYRLRQGANVDSKKAILLK
jgi:hypothetical protein